nr:hypothetical protein [uncultured Rhodococcus sp.]
MNSRIHSLAIASGDSIIGVGAIVADDASTFFVPDGPDERAVGDSAVRMPLTGHFDAPPAVSWVSLRGTLIDEAIVVDTIDSIERPTYPGEPVLRITGSAGSNWSNDALLAAVEKSESNLRSASGAYRDSNGTLVLTLHYLYLDRGVCEWLARPHPGPLEVWVAIRPATPEVATAAQNEYDSQ